MLKPPPVYDVRLVLRPEEDTQYVHFESAAAHPFQSDPTGFPRVNVWWLIEAALLTYWDPGAALPIYKHAGLDGQLVSANGTDCYLLWNDSSVIVAFRGTESDQWDDVFTDVQFAQVPWRVGKVHMGFAAAVQQVWPDLEPAIAALAATRAVWFTGHSLGAALAVLAADLYAGTRGICTFGCPRIGDPEFARAFTSRFVGRHLRYVNNRDVVTHVPPPLFAPFVFRHVDPRQFIAGDGTVSYGGPAIPHFFGDLFGSPRILAETIQGLDHGTLKTAPLFVLDHMPQAYAIWAWNDYDTNG